MFKIPDALLNLTAYEPVVGDFKVRLDANEAENFNFSPETAIKLSKIDINRYPDPECRALKAAYKEFLNGYYDVSVLEKNITAGNGSDELISLIINTFASDNSAVIVSAPDFSMYKIYTETRKAAPVTAAKEESLSPNPLALQRAAEETGANLIIFSNPCNPTGLACDKKDIETLLKNTDALVVVDEAYGEFMDVENSLLGGIEKYDNLIVLKTLSKIGAAGLRLGFALANEKLSKILNAVRSPYNIDTVSQVLGTEFIKNGNLKERIEQTKQLKTVFTVSFEKIKALFNAPVKLYPDSQTNFFYIETEKAAEIAEYFAGRGIAIRAFKNAIRVSIGSPDEMTIFYKVFSSILN